jgi:hypothetical protein
MPRTVILSDCEFLVQEAADGGVILAIKEPDSGDLYQIEFKREARGRLVARLTGVALPTIRPLAVSSKRNGE